MVLTEPLGPSLLLLTLESNAARVWHTQVLTVSWGFCFLCCAIELGVSCCKIAVVSPYVYLSKEKLHHRSPW